MEKYLRDDNTLSLTNGKVLAYAEYGNPNGIPILVHHGNPGSRLFWGLLPGSPFNSRYRLIAPDRPGYGLSDHHGKDSLSKWPNIVRELLSYLGLEKVYNAGVSGGGPYALAVAAALPDRIRKTLLIGPVGPFNDKSQGDMNSNRILFRIIHITPWLIRLQFKLMIRMLKKNPDSYLNLVKKKLKGPDLEAANNKQLMRKLKLDILEAHRQGEAGSFYDLLYPGAWPIDLEKIRGVVEIWYGEADRSVGGMPKYLSENIPAAELHVLEGEGHLSIINRFKSIFEDFIE